MPPTSDIHSSAILGTIKDRCSDQQLRAFASRCCQRIWSHYPEEWADQVFANDNMFSGHYVGPEYWKQLRELVHAFDIEAGADRLGSAETRQQLDQFANVMEGKMSFVSQRLGDSASGPEYEVGRVTLCAARALRCATAKDIRNNVIECAKQAAYAIGFRWKEADESAAVDAEKRVQAIMIQAALQDPDKVTAE